MIRPTRPAAVLAAVATAAAGAVVLAPPAGAATAPAVVRNSCSVPLPASVEGAPASFKARAPEGVYVWHTSAGWRIRVTHDEPKVNGKAVKVVVRGTVVASRPLSRVRTVRLEPRQRGEWVAVKLPARRAMGFSFVNYGGVDGVDFAAGCAGRIRVTVWKLVVVDGKATRTALPVFVGKDALRLSATTTPALDPATDVAAFTVLRVAP